MSILSFIFVAGFDKSDLTQCPGCKNKIRITNNTIKNKTPTNANNNIKINLPLQQNKTECPALMSDGRFLTYHNSTNELTEAIRKLNGFTSSNQFRNFMQNNADLFMNAERNQLLKENSCRPKTACSEGWYKLWTQNNGDWSQLK